MAAQVAGACVGAMRRQPHVRASGSRLCRRTTRSSGALWLARSSRPSGCCSSSSASCGRAGPQIGRVRGRRLHRGGVLVHLVDQLRQSRGHDRPRSLTDTFAGIAPSVVPAFVVAQIVGGAARGRRWRGSSARTSRGRSRHAPRRDRRDHRGGLTCPSRGLTVDQNLALRSAAQRLAQEFAGVFGEETIERFLTTSYDQFARPRNASTNFLPLMAERFARQRLKALATRRGQGGRRAADRPLPLRPQRGAVPDGTGVVQPPGR